ncbi:hypothetical protein, partial [Treponema socranskii]|uniref:hypothetical protein n=1 Tax=Treponema socranskii TaxID=53419 RepID=UPI003D93DA34
GKNISFTELYLLNPFSFRNILSISPKLGFYYYNSLSGVKPYTTATLLRPKVQFHFKKQA